MVWFSSRMPTFSTIDITTRNNTASARSRHVDTSTKLAIAAIAHNQSSSIIPSAFLLVELWACGCEFSRVIASWLVRTSMQQPG